MCGRGLSGTLQQCRSPNVLDDDDDNNNNSSYYNYNYNYNYTQRRCPSNHNNSYKFVDSHSNQNYYPGSTYCQHTGPWFH
jgi:hypothetical protein